MHKEFVPPGQTVKGKLYWDVLRRLRENIQRKLPDKRRKNSWVLHHDNAPTHASLVVQQFLASTNKTFIPQPPKSPDLAPLWYFSYSRTWNWSSSFGVLTALKRSRPYRRMWRRRWRELTSRSTSDRGNPAGITVLMPKGTAWKGMGANRNFVKWLSYNKGITGTFE